MKTEILDKLKENSDLFRRLGVERIGLFGSYARDEAAARSDIDFIVEFRQGMKSYDSLVELYDFLQSTFGKKIDLLTPEALSPLIKPYIDKEIIYERF